MTKMSKAIKELIEALLNAMTKFINMVVPVLGVAFICVVIYMGWKIVGFFKTETSYQEMYKSSPISVKQNNTLISSVAAIDLLFLKIDGRKDDKYIELSKLEEIAPGSVTGYCMYSLDAYFGLNDVGKKVEQLVEKIKAADKENREQVVTDELSKPEYQSEIIAIYSNDINGMPNKDMVMCLGFNEVSKDKKREKIEDGIKHSLLANDLLNIHIKTAQNQFRSLLVKEANHEGVQLCAQKNDYTCLDKAERVAGIKKELDEVKSIVDNQNKFYGIAEQNVHSNVDLQNGVVGGVKLANFTPKQNELRKTYTMANENKASNDLAFTVDNLSGSMGYINLTISTIHLSTAKLKKWYHWKPKEGIYIQKDITKVIYGTGIEPETRHNNTFWMKEPVTTKIYEEPYIVAIDRSTVKNYGHETYLYDDVVNDSKKKKAVEHLTLIENAGAKTTMGYINNEINQSINAVINKMHSKMVNITKQQIIQSELSKSKQGHSVNVKFKSGEKALFGKELLDMGVQSGEL